MSDSIWESFDSLFKTIERQGRRVEELESRVLELERRLRERPGFAPPVPRPVPLGFYLCHPDGRRELVIDPAQSGRIVAANFAGRREANPEAASFTKARVRDDDGEPPAA